MGPYHSCNGLSTICMAVGPAQHIMRVTKTVRIVVKIQKEHISFMWINVNKKQVHLCHFLGRFSNAIIEKATYNKSSSLLKKQVNEECKRAQQ